MKWSILAISFPHICTFSQMVNFRPPQINKKKETVIKFVRCNVQCFVGDSVELPKWLNSASGTKKSPKSNPSCLVEGTLSIGWHWGFECSKC